MQGIITTIQNILNSIIPVLVALGVVYFVWGVVQYFIADAEEAKKTGKDRIIYGVIGLAIIVSLWGIVNLITNTFFTEATLTRPKTGQLVSLSNCAAQSGKLQGLLCDATALVSSIIPLLLALAVVMFVWGVVKYFIIGAGEEAKRTQGKQFMIWAIIALVVITSVWGIVKILVGTFPGLRGYNTVLPGVKPRGAPSMTDTGDTGGTTAGGTTTPTPPPSPTGGGGVFWPTEPDICPDGSPKPNVGPCPR